jgi:uncharacterized membrane-anchored protein YjiN (DUF445 family)
MRNIATSLLCLMAILYIVARIFEHRIPALKYLVAFSEAGIVGALADWFAVVALFKHPLGIPIWHTAIITKKKSEISRTLAHFVVDNFLTRNVIGKKLEHYDFSLNAGSKLLENKELISTKAVEFVPAFFKLLNDKDIQNLIHGQLTAKLQNINVAPLAGEALDVLTSGDKFHELFDEVVRVVQKLARDNKAYILKAVRAEIPLPDVYILENIKEGVAQWLSEKISDKIKDTTEELENDESHELRKSFKKHLEKIIRDLKHSPELAAKGEAIVRMLLEHPVVRNYILNLWSDIKKMIVDDAQAPDSVMKKQLGDLLEGLSNRILMDESFKGRINDWIIKNILLWMEKYKDEVRNTIIKTVEGWKDEEIVEKLELSVGKDLQYIRLNGTLVGGIAGLAIFSIYQAIIALIH